jgi:hypothetical protein
MSLSKRAVVAPIVTVATVAALVFGTGALTASAVTPVFTSKLTKPMLTLPLTDGFNDVSSLSVTSSSSTPVSVASTGVFNGTTITLTKDAGDANFSGSLSLAALNPTAGSYTTQLTQDSAPAVAGPTIVVGSGKAITATVAVSATTVFVNGSPDVPLTGTVTAQDETGTFLPVLSGELLFMSSTGNHSDDGPIISNGPSVPGATLVPASSLGWDVGTTSLSVDLVEGPTDNDPGVATNGFQIAVQLAPVLTGVALSRSLSTVYPSKDGYRDTVRFSVTPVLLNPGPFHYTGSIVIKKGTKVVKAFSYSGSTSSSVVWNGRVGTKLKSGTYSVAATMTGRGVTAHASTSVVVSGKKLHLRKKSVSVAANSFFSASHDVLDSSTKGTSKFATSLTTKARTQAGTNGSCALHGKSLYCSSANGGFSGRFGYTSVPRYVLASTAFRPYAAHLSIKVTEQKHSKTSGPIYDWLSDDRGEIAHALITNTGYKVTPTAHFTAADNLQGLIIETVNSSSIHISSIKLTYSYYTLS